MADTLKVLAQSYPSSGSLTAAYTCGSASGASVSSIVICNQGAAATTFRISIAIAGAADTAAQYLYYNTSIDGNSTFVATIGVTLANTDVIRVYSVNGALSFSLYGVEVA
jgi:hypothetical protein